MTEYEKLLLAVKVPLVYMGEKLILTIKELLDEVNRDRNPEWIDYTISDIVKHGFVELFGWLYYYEIQGEIK